tara:strand:+ start:354 stop:470 length:117 start_codon:yes stop_codon:yes gene_type:complete
MLCEILISFSLSSMQSTGQTFTQQPQKSQEFGLISIKI